MLRKSVLSAIAFAASCSVRVRPGKLLGSPQPYDPAQHEPDHREQPLVDRREIMNGLLYLLTTGCQWRQLPKDLPPRSTVHDYRPFVITVIQMGFG